MIGWFIALKSLSMAPWMFYMMKWDWNWWVWYE